MEASVLHSRESFCLLLLQNNIIISQQNNSILIATLTPVKPEHTFEPVLGRIEGTTYRYGVLL